MLPTLSVNPWENRLGTSSSMISILRPLNSPTSYRQILCFSGSWHGKKTSPQPRSKEEISENLKALDSFYHFDGPEGEQVVVLLAVAPGVPAGVLSLLQDVHLTAEVHLLEAHIPAGSPQSVSWRLI